MDVGAFTSGLLTGLREGVEAALIVSIILAYLAKTETVPSSRKIYVGTGAAILVERPPRDHPVPDDRWPPGAV